MLLLVLMLATASADMVSISELRQQVEAMGQSRDLYNIPNSFIYVNT